MRTMSHRSTRALRFVAISLVTAKGLSMLWRHQRSKELKTTDRGRLDAVGVASQDSFPASDPPSFSPGTT